MKYLFLLAGLFGFSSGLYGCGGSTGPSCSEVCNKMAECNPEQAQGCETDCQKMKDLIRSSVFKALGECFLETDCETLNNNGDICMVDAVKEIPSGVVDDFIDSICTKIITCDETLTKNQCISTMKDKGGDSVQMIGMYSDSTIDCVTSCFSDKSCTEIKDKDDDSMDACMTQCGLNFEDD